MLQYTGDNIKSVDMSRWQFQDLIVQEGVLDVMRLTTVSPQYESQMNRAYGPLYKELTIKRLHRPTLFIIDES